MGVLPLSHDMIIGTICMGVKIATKVVDNAVQLMLLGMGGNQNLSLGLLLFGIHLVCTMGGLFCSTLCFSNIMEETGLPGVGRYTL